ncbi:hypothetical protein HHK36_032160 [Tetracentron sinense]|uniref:Uncharacterized protein n=1 Tax=Tetracentron sinense TaxID=13715 RepID=A0A834Y7R6_TETSI|nr:hypothetical protein HHK36_032160 [Tetracentron sinense]
MNLGSPQADPIPLQLAAFLEARFKEHSERQDHINHYIFTDSDVAMIDDDLGQLFYNYPNFDLALTFWKNKDQPLNSGFVAVRGTPDGILSSKYMKASGMLGDQLALAWVVKSHPSFDAKRYTRPQAFLEEIRGASVLFLPCAIYNWRPPEGAGKFHGMPLDAKGSRKRLMLESWNLFNSSAYSDISDMLCLILKSGRTKTISRHGSAPGSSSSNLVKRQAHFNQEGTRWEFSLQLSEESVSVALQDCSYAG